MKEHKPFDTIRKSVKITAPEDLIIHNISVASGCNNTSDLLREIIIFFINNGRKKDLVSDTTQVSVDVCFSMNYILQDRIIKRCRKLGCTQTVLIRSAIRYAQINNFLENA